MNAQLRERFLTEWPKVYKRVLAEAVFVLRRSGWKQARGATFRNRAEDLAQEALLLVLEGRRNWDPEKVGLVAYLAGIMRSLVSNEASSPAARTIPWEDSISDGGDGDAEYYSGMATAPARGFGASADGMLYGEMASSPEELMIARESTEVGMGELYAAAGGDKLLVGILDAIRSGCESLAEVARKLRVPVGDVYEAMRRLRRCATPHVRKRALA